MPDVINSAVNDPALRAQPVGDQVDTHFSTAVRDYVDGSKKWKFWLSLAYAEIRRRYRRTLIGPFWTTLSIAIFIGTMGIIFSMLWHQRINEYLPFFCSGYIVWTFLSVIVTDSCSTFIAMEAYMKQVSMPYSLYAFVVVSRNVMVFFHQIVVFIVVAILFHVQINHYTLLVLPGFLLLVLNATWIALALGLLCARYRDIQQVVTSLLQISMFVTPIFWAESQLGHTRIAKLIVDLNPIYHFISVVRYPLLGEAARPISWVADMTILLLGWFFTMHYLKRSYHKLIYWL